MARLLYTKKNNLKLTPIFRWDKIFWCDGSRLLLPRRLLAHLYIPNSPVLENALCHCDSHESSMKKSYRNRIFIMKCGTHQWRNHTL